MLMTLTVAATHDFPDTTDLGYLLHKHPDKVQAFGLSVGSATVLYPEASPESTCVALILDVDSAELGKTQPRYSSSEFALGRYVNDRPYAGASLLAVALSRVFKQAMTGTCTARPELPDLALSMTVNLPSVPCRGGSELAAELFEPLGWTVDARPIPLDARIERWGDSVYLDLTLTGTFTVSAALRHLYVLLPVLDDVKHYWVGEDEADKLVRAAGDWLGDHPQIDLIAGRYLKHRRELVASVVDRLVPGAAADERAPRDPRLSESRAQAVVAELQGAKSVVDLGCGEGRLLRELFADSSFESIVGVDVSARALATAEKRLRLQDLPDRQRTRIQLRQSSATYRDSRLSGFDAMVLMEVIEHVEPDRLPALERSVFREARPTKVLVTTPNSEYNILYDGLAHGEFRHPDHRFEFTRAQFAEWAAAVAERADYDVRHGTIGPVDDALGAPTQMAIFTRREVKA
ncbi:3' terminal RNA ribose 2'-O-methyltransferase Hen1 [Rhodococcus sp. G-MC3]|uniref:3' terminal RNA ribose 2'-O-methyltransferase Hen1 n=1 Tax=Rhodococcus sp. G-MC3 TaxID=3046209 RepID=UPI0024BAF8D8|nr:3' terminal RNA ribose 2'-O-methyltransferase Hen1 [Rhodococcus sp. G-MC3]MDJ0392232.1 3' terminal RNA ribose 2'-O-methyltransferase Hen1 [Rhodococcus sp. G-MC3]